MFTKFINLIKRSIKKYPMTSFFGILIILFAVIFVGNLLRKPEEIKREEAVQAKKTEVFSFGETPYLTLSAKVDKKNVITVNATTNGIVKYINAYEGQKVYPGTTLVSLTDTYGGANISAVDLKIAQKTKEIQDITYEKNEDILDYQRDIVPKTDGEDNEVARKQVTVQKRNLDLTKETIDLNLEKAKIANSLHYPSAPASGVVEKIHVRPGQQVQAGTPLVSFVVDKSQGTAEILTSIDIAKMISVKDKSFLNIDGDIIEAVPIYISKESTNDQQYSVFYSIPSEYLDKIADKSFIQIDIPLENYESLAAKPMIPIDAVQLTQEKAYVFIIVDGIAESREVILGNVFGQLVQVEGGISEEDLIILNRNVFQGDEVEIIEG